MADRVDQDGTEPPVDPVRAAPHAGKFRVALSFLTGIGLAAVVVAAVLLINGRSTSQSTGPWSSWSPTSSGPAIATEIANHVAPSYRISGTSQLDIVTVVHTADASAVAAAGSGTSATPANGLEVAVKASTTGSQVSLLGGTTVGYNLCGIGTSNCAIGTGPPSVARTLLLKREAMELALYTFHYMPGVQNVVALLPPGHSQQVTSVLTPKPPRAGAKPVTKTVQLALLFLRDELSPLLAHPISLILPEPYPPTVSEMSGAVEATLVEQVTARGLFNEHLQQAPDGSSVLVLDQQPPS